MIDLHCHVLPGLDDGPQDMDASLTLARAAVAAGVETIVATPHADGHFRVGSEARDAALARVRDALAAEQIPLELLPGAEIALDRYIDIDDAERDALRLGGGPYLLLESPLGQAAGAFDRFIATLLSAGHRIVLAHPERCPTFQRHPDRLERLVHGGALTSITAGAFVGRFGSPVRDAAFAMLRDGLVHNVASDAHDAIHRPPGMAAELEQAGLGELAPWLTREVPAAILSGGPIPLRPPVDLPAARRGMLGRLLRRSG